MKLISWNIDSLNAALTSDSARAQLSQAVLQTLQSPFRKQNYLRQVRQKNTWKF